VCACWKGGWLRRSLVVQREALFELRKVVADCLPLSMTVESNIASRAFVQRQYLHYRRLDEERNVSNMQNMISHGRQESRTWSQVVAGRSSTQTAASRKALTVLGKASACQATPQQSTEPSLNPCALEWVPIQDQSPRRASVTIPSKKKKAQRTRQRQQSEMPANAHGGDEAPVNSAYRCSMLRDEVWHDCISDTCNESLQCPRQPQQSTASHSEPDWVFLQESTAKSSDTTQVDSTFVGRIAHALGLRNEHDKL